MSLRGAPAGQAESVPAAAPARRRRPTWESLALAGVLAAFAVATTWNIEREDYALFYASAVRSMSMSWRALAFGAVDPSATVTMDKLAGFLVPQALSVRLLGFHAWSLALPQVVEGLVTVLACYVIAARWRGRRAGLLSASAAAATPLLASMFGHTMEDGLLTMALACAFACWQAAVRSGRLAPLVGAGVLVGVGFQAKMAQAWLPLPALAVGLLLVRHQRVPVRLVRAGVLVAVAVAASLSWTAAIQAVPADRRPFVDGTTDDNMFTMVLGYNGLERVLPGAVPGALGGPWSAASAAAQSGAGPATGAFKLLGDADLSQVGWLYPLVAAGLVAVGAEMRAQRRRRLAADGADGAPSSDVATLAALFCWLAVAVVVLSEATVPHTAYLAAVAVPVAVLAGTGLSAILTGLRGGTARARTWSFAAVLAQAAWTAAILVGYGDLPAALVVPLVALGALAVAGAAAAAWRWPAVPWRAASAVVVVGVLVAPAAWTGFVLDPHDRGGDSEAYTGPPPAGGATGTARPFTFEVPAPWGGRDQRQDATGRALATYVRRQAPHGSGQVVLTDYWGSAASLVVWSALDAGSAGGFSGHAPTLTPDALSTAIRAGALSFAFLQDRPTYVGGRHERHLSPLVRSDDAVVRALCRAVSATTWDAHGSSNGQTLYDCRR